MVAAFYIVVSLEQCVFVQKNKSIVFMVPGLSIIIYKICGLLPVKKFY